MPPGSQAGLGGCASLDPPCALQVPEIAGGADGLQRGLPGRDQGATAQRDGHVRGHFQVETKALSRVLGPRVL